MATPCRDLASRSMLETLRGASDTIAEQRCTHRVGRAVNSVRTRTDPTLIEAID